MVLLSIIDYHINDIIDRCWAVANKDGSIIDQAKVPKLATVIPTLQEDSAKGSTLILSVPGMEPLTISPPLITEMNEPTNIK